MGATGLPSSLDPVGRLRGVSCRTPSTTLRPRERVVHNRTGERTNKPKIRRHQQPKSKNRAIIRGRAPVLLIGIFLNLSDPSVPKELEDVWCDRFPPKQARGLYHLRAPQSQLPPTCLHKLFIWVFHARHSLKRCSVVCLLPDSHHPKDGQTDTDLLGPSGGRPPRGTDPNMPRLDRRLLLYLRRGWLADYRRSLGTGPGNEGPGSPMHRLR